MRKNENQLELVRMLVSIFPPSVLANFLRSAYDLSICSLKTASSTWVALFESYIIYTTQYQHECSFSLKADFLILSSFEFLCETVIPSLSFLSLIEYFICEDSALQRAYQVGLLLLALKALLLPLLNSLYLYLENVVCRQKAKEKWILTLQKEPKNN